MASIDLDQVSVRFPIHGSRLPQAAPSRRTVGGIIKGRRGGPAVVAALEDLSVVFNRGDRIGLIGPNGSGKSTLLRLIAGVYEPCRGRVRISGRVLPLFDSMLGMSGEFTGRENIVLRGIHMGLTPRHALAQAEEIAEFSELGDFMELPLKTYSLGMQLRLAFSIATAFEAEILLLDEQFMAGDAAFIDKAERRMKAFVGRAGILVQASHSERIIRETCNRVALLEQGRLVAIGKPDEMFDRYRERRVQEPTLAA
jgi:ABC-2 type transport system ATP-binding protein/lipopolysaccharide transport system ATP-binding protein